MPTAAVIATAVASAAVRIEVRPSDVRKLCIASAASTPAVRCKTAVIAVALADIRLGIKMEVPITSNNTAAYPKIGEPAIGGAFVSPAATTSNTTAIRI